MSSENRTSVGRSIKRREARAEFKILLFVVQVSGILKENFEEAAVHIKKPPKIMNIYLI